MTYSLTDIPRLKQYRKLTLKEIIDKDPYYIDHILYRDNFDLDEQAWRYYFDALAGIGEEKEKLK